MNIPKIKARRELTKDQRVAIVEALHGITPEQIPSVTITLDTEPMSLLGFRNAKQAHNLYYWLTTTPLFEGLPEYKPKHRTNHRNCKYYGATCPLSDVVFADADKAMKLYGHPAHAATILRQQADTYKTNGIETDYRLSYVISELECRAQEKTHQNWHGHWVSETDWYILEGRLAAIGKPLTPIGLANAAQ